MPFVAGWGGSVNNQQKSVCGENTKYISRDLFSVFSLEYRREWVNEVYTRGATFYLIDYKKNVDLATWLQKTAFYIWKEYVVKIVCAFSIMYFAINELVFLL